MRIWSQLTNGITGTVLQQAASPGEGWVEVPQDTLPGQVLDGGVYRDATTAERHDAGFRRCVKLREGVVAEVTEVHGVPDGWQEAPAWVGLGDVYADGEFTRPAPVVPADPCEWLLDVGTFFDRFAGAKMAVLTSAHPVAQAVIRDASVRKWIDLRKPDVAAGIDALIAAAVPGVTPTLKAAILDTPVTDEENRAVRKLFFSGAG